MDLEQSQEDIIISTEKSAIIHLLELYKDFPCLWNTGHSLYCNKDARNQAFQILLEKWKTYYPLATNADVKKKIEHLRAAYRRERNKVESSKTSGAGVENLHKPALWYYQHLCFLHEKTSPASEIVDNLETNNCASIEEPVTKKEKSTTKRQNNIFKKQEELLESAKQLMNATSSSELTSADAFGHSVSSQLKELPKMQRVICEKLIGELLFYAKLGELTLDTSISLNPHHHFTQPYNKPVLQYQLHTPQQSASSIQSSPYEPSPSPRISHPSQYQPSSSPQHSHPSQYQPSPSPSPSPQHSHPSQYQPSPSPQHSHPSQYQPSPSPSPSPQHSHPSQYQPSPSPSPSPQHSHPSQYQPSPSPSPSPQHSHPSQHQPSPSPSPSPQHSHPSQYQPSPSPSPSPQHSHPSQHQPSPSPYPQQTHPTQYRLSPSRQIPSSFQKSITSAHTHPTLPQIPIDELLIYSLEEHSTQSQPLSINALPDTSVNPSNRSKQNVFKGKGIDIKDYLIFKK